MNGAQISFFGRLTRDPEMRYGKDKGTPYATVGIANNYRQRADQEPETTFFEVTLWGPPRPALRRALQKGRRDFHSGGLHLQGVHQEGRTPRL